MCKDSGGKCNAGNENPAAAAACRDCNRAAECSCALRRNSATELDRGSDVLVGDSDEPDDADVVGGFMGQHEHRPGKAVKIKSMMNFKHKNQYNTFSIWDFEIFVPKLIDHLYFHIWLMIEYFL